MIKPGQTLPDVRNDLLAGLTKRKKPTLKQDIEAGRQFAESVLGEEGLGRLEGRPELEALKQQIASTQQSAAQRAGQQVDLGPQATIDRARIAQSTIGKVRDIDKVRDIQADPELADIQGRLRTIADEGLSRQELQIQREQASREIGRTTQTASRRAQALLASAGVRGAVAGRQLLDVELAGANKRADIEQQLFLESERLKREATGQLGQFALSRQAQTDSRQLQLEGLRQQRSTNLAQLGLQRGTSQAQLNQQRLTSQAQLRQQGQISQAELRQQQAISAEQLQQGRITQQFDALRGQSELLTGIATFDLGQAAREKDILLQAGLGFAQIGSAERTGEKQADAVAQQQPVECFLPGQKVLMEDGSTKNIEDLEPNDMVAEGGRVQMVGYGIAHQFCDYNGVKITPGHAVHDGTGWVEVQHISPVTIMHPKGTKVYNVVTDNHKLIVENQLVGDYYEPHGIDGLKGLVYNMYKKITSKLKKVVKRRT